MSADHAFDAAFAAQASAINADAAAAAAIAADEAAIAQDNLDFTNATTSDAAYDAIQRRHAHERALGEHRRAKVQTARDLQAARARYSAAAAAVK